MVDIPNSMDDQWKITVDKSGAQLPGALRKRLLKWVENSVINRSRGVFRHRASNEMSGRDHPVWREKRRADKQEFAVDLGHPIIKSFIEGLGRGEKAEFKKIIGVIEKCLPINTIHSAISDNPELVIQGYVEVPEEMKGWAKEFALRSLNEGKKKADILQSILLMQPFSNFPSEITEFLESEGIFGG